MKSEILLTIWEGMTESEQEDFLEHARATYKGAFSIKKAFVKSPLVTPYPVPGFVSGAPLVLSPIAVPPSGVSGKKELFVEGAGGLAWGQNLFFKRAKGLKPGFTGLKGIDGDFMSGTMLIDAPAGTYVLATKKKGGLVDIGSRWALEFWHVFRSKGASVPSSSGAVFFYDVYDHVFSGSDWTDVESALLKEFGPPEAGAATY